MNMSMSTHGDKVKWQLKQSSYVQKSQRKSDSKLMDLLRSNLLG